MSHSSCKNLCLQGRCHSLLFTPPRPRKRWRSSGSARKRLKLIELCVCLHLPKFICLIPKKGKSYEFEDWDSWRQDNGILCRRKTISNIKTSTISSKLTMNFIIHTFIETMSFTIFLPLFFFTRDTDDCWLDERLECTDNAQIMRAEINSGWYCQWCQWCQSSGGR